MIQDLTAHLQQSVEAATVSEATAVVFMYLSSRMVPVMSTSDRTVQLTAYIDLHRMDLVDLHQKLVSVSLSLYCFCDGVIASIFYNVPHSR